jgi:hypothetical protein
VVVIVFFLVLYCFVAWVLLGSRPLWLPWLLALAPVALAGVFEGASSNGEVLLAIGAYASLLLADAVACAFAARAIWARIRPDLIQDAPTPQ